MWRPVTAFAQAIRDIRGKLVCQGEERWRIAVVLMPASSRFSDDECPHNRGFPGAASRMLRSLGVSLRPSRELQGTSHEERSSVCINVTGQPLLRR